MDCLKDYIGILGCGWVPRTFVSPLTLEDVFSGLYVNQLPGITLKSVDKIANSEQVTFLGVWNEIQKRALLKFGIALRGRLNVKHSLVDKTVVDCIVCFNKAAFAPALQYLLGVELMTEALSSERTNWFTIKRDQAEMLRTEFYAEYQACFEDGFNSIDITGSDCLVDDCLECNGDHIAFVESLP